jgi:hypothetical protein
MLGGIFVPKQKEETRCKQHNENGMGRTCSTYGRHQEMRTLLWSRKLKRRELLEDLYVDGSIM